MDSKEGWLFKIYFFSFFLWVDSSAAESSVIILLAIYSLIPQYKQSSKQIILLNWEAVRCLRPPNISILRGSLPLQEVAPKGC